jgi:hypothetical protein
MSAITDQEPVVTTRPRPRQPRSGARAIDLVWLTWRQHRSAIIAAVVLAGTLTASMAYVAGRIAAINAKCGNVQCPTNSSQAQALLGQFGLLELSVDFGIAVVVTPLLFGVFLGAPLLAREHEQRTLLLAWSQDVSPARWLWSKLTLLGGLTAALTAAVAAESDHLAHAYGIASGESLFSGLSFLDTGMVPLVLSVVWFAVSVALGAAFRRTLPAIFVSVAAFFAHFFLVQWRYPTFVTPLTTVVPLGQDQPGQGALDPNALLVNSLGRNLVDGTGHSLTPEALQALCPSQGPLSNDHGVVLNGQCLSEHGVGALVHYQPGSRIPEFHLILNGGYLGLGIIAVLVTWWLVRRTSLSAG